MAQASRDGKHVIDIALAGNDLAYRPAIEVEAENKLPFRVRIPCGFLARQGDREARARQHPADSQALEAKYAPANHDECEEGPG